jgi:hypothetical protein
MRKLLLCLALVGLLVLAVGLTTRAADLLTPAVSTIQPASAFNDIDTHVTITGVDFASDASGTPPAVTLETTALTDVTRVDTQTLTATVPWGMDPGVYALTVVNPGGGTAEPLLPTFEVKSGINTWNAGVLNGASVRELVMKPGDSNTLYALAYDVGVFRSRDAGENWTFTSANVIGNAVFTVDPYPGHESWLYSAMNNGVFVSKDEGDSWTQLPDPVRDNVIRSAQVFPSPHTSGTLFVSYYGDTTPTSIIGLRKSTDGGAHWSSVHEFDGVPVQSVAFDPTPGNHGMVLVTTDAHVYKSPDEGETWNPVLLPPPLPLGIGMTGYITYNPYRSDEVWVSSTESNGGLFKTTISSVTTWTNVSLGGSSGCPVTFAGPDDVYVWCAQSHNGGTTWSPFGPWPTWGDGQVVFPRNGSVVDTHTVYVTNSRTGVQKSTDGGSHWDAQNRGLAGMRCTAMSVSKIDPLRVYATFDGWGGVYISDDGTSHWSYTPIEGSGQAWSVLEDLFDARRVYLSGGGFYWSTNTGASWDGGPWNGVPDSQQGLMGSLAEDPFEEPGHLLVASRVGQSSTHDHDLGYLFSSDDFGASWQPVVISATETSIGPVNSIVFDPATAGTVYLTTDGNGVWKSVDHGHSGTWTRIDDRAQPWMANDYSICLATHPQRVLLVSGDSGRPFRSFDGGATWQNAEGSGEASARTYVFVDGDSTRLYSPDWTGLHFSSNVGYADMDGHTILYAATTGGKTGVVIAGAASSVAAASLTSRSALAAAAAPSTLVGAGIYRRAQVSTTATFTSTGSQDGWVLESSHTSSRGGTTNSSSTTLRLGDNASKKQYRSVLSFGTSGLPDSAVITKVTLRVKKQGVTGGGDPVTKFQGFMVDVKKGYFGTSATLQTSDFQATANRSYGYKPSPVGGWYSFNLTGAKAYVSKTSSSSGRTQVRLRFKLDDNGNAVANYLRLYSGNASTAYRPQLVVTYYVP